MPPPEVADSSKDGNGQEGQVKNTLIETFRASLPEAGGGLSTYCTALGLQGRRHGGKANPQNQHPLFHAVKLRSQALPETRKKQPEYQE